MRVARPVPLLQVPSYPIGHEVRLVGRGFHPGILTQLPSFLIPLALVPVRATNSCTGTRIRHDQHGNIVKLEDHGQTHLLLESGTGATDRMFKLTIVYALVARVLAHRLAPSSQVCGLLASIMPSFKCGRSIYCSRSHLGAENGRMIASAGALIPNVSATREGSTVNFLHGWQSNGHSPRNFGSPVVMVRPTNRLDTGTHVCAWWHPIFNQILTPDNHNPLIRDRDDTEPFFQTASRSRNSRMKRQDWL